MGRSLILKEKTGLEQLSDIEIIERMSYGEVDTKKSHDAFGEFHRRYAEWVFSTCSYICRMLPDSGQIAKDLTEDILIRAFSYAGSYNPNRASMKTWLNKIAQNEFNDFYAEYRKNHSIEAAEEDRSTTLVIENDEPIDRSKVNTDRLGEALIHLSDQERDIVLTHMMHKDIDNLDSQIPAEIMDDLCRHYKKKPNAIRKIKSRAMSKIKAFMLNH